MLGSFSLAISGALTGIKNGLDGFGILIIAFVTAVGGGTLRDMLMEDKQVFWFVNVTYLYVIIAGALVGVIFQKQNSKFTKPLLIFDAIGLGLFTISGVQIGLDAELQHINCLILGTITGAFGGVIRDVLVNEVPVIFKKEIYATISLLGGGLYLVLDRLDTPEPWLQIISILAIIIARLLALKFKISLPSLVR